VRIAFLVPSPASPTDPSLGPASGGYLYDERMTTGLRARGHEVDLLWTGRTSDEAEIHRVAEHVRAKPYDVLLEDELGFEAYASVNASLRQREVGAALVGLIHVPAVLLEWAPRSAEAERRFLGTVDAAVYVSRTVRRDTEALLGVRVPGYVVPPGADSAPRGLRSPGTRASDGPIHLVSVGHLLPHKGYLELVDVLRRLATDRSAPEWTASWIGDLELAPAYREAVLSRLREASLVDRVQLTGRRAPHEVARALGSADLFVTASRYESHGFAVAEALAAGVPIVGWTAGGLWEHLRPGRDSIRLRWGEVDRFAETLRRLLGDEAARAALAEGAAESSHALGTWPQRAAEMEAALESVLAARREGCRHAAG
jgi:glycosyltransferase involved in cell wall biosynthesis